MASGVSVKCAEPLRLVFGRWPRRPVGAQSGGRQHQAPGALPAAARASGHSGKPIAAQKQGCLLVCTSVCPPRPAAPSPKPSPVCLSVASRTRQHIQRCRLCAGLASEGALRRHHTRLPAAEASARGHPPARCPPSRPQRRRGCACCWPPRRRPSRRRRRRRAGPPTSSQPMRWPGTTPPPASTCAPARSSRVGGCGCSSGGGRLPPPPPLQGRRPRHACAAARRRRDAVDAAGRG